jgi:hypothetical protein
MTEERPRKRRVTFADLAARPNAAHAAGLGAAAPAAARPIERVTYADLAALSKRPEDFAGTPVPAAPETGIPDPGLPEPAEAEKGIPVPAIPGSQVDAPRALTAAFQRQTVRQAIAAKDGHSFGEQAVYEALWANAAPSGPDQRTIVIGYRALSMACGLTVNNCKANLRSLARKLAIDEAAGHSYTQAKTYVVYHATAILKRRRAAGLTHYIKSRGILFVNPETGQPAGIPETGIPIALTAAPAPDRT